jgi:hypothetical protein
VKKLQRLGREEGLHDDHRTATIVVQRRQGRCDVGLHDGEFRQSVQAGKGLGQGEQARDVLVQQAQAADARRDGTRGPSGQPRVCDPKALFEPEGRDARRQGQQSAVVEVVGVEARDAQVAQRRQRMEDGNEQLVLDHARRPRRTQDQRLEVPAPPFVVQLELGDLERVQESRGQLGLASSPDVVVFCNHPNVLSESGSGRQGVRQPVKGVVVEGRESRKGLEVRTRHDDGGQRAQVVVIVGVWVMMVSVTMTVVVLVGGEIQGYVRVWDVECLDKGGQ